MSTKLSRLAVRDKVTLGMMKIPTQMLRILLIFIISTTGFSEITKEDSPTAHLIPCKEGWYLFGQKCYKVFGQNVRRSWTKASSTCLSLGGHLVAIESKELQDFLTFFLMLNKRSDLWIGLNEKTDKWSDGSILNYTNWMPSKSGSRYQENCARMVFIEELEMAGRWNYHPCTNELPFICQVNQTEQAESPDPRFCSLEKGGGFKHLNSCYNVVTKEDSWDDAEKYCQDNFNGHLVTILNSESDMFLRYVSSSIYKNIWIGIKIRDQNLQKWSSGWHVIFNRWADENELITGYCGLKTRYVHWISDHCSKKYPFICETSSNKPPIYKQGTEGWRCPALSKDWKEFEGDYCYIFETTKSLRWYEANYDCMTKGGTLAKISSEEESISIHQHIINTQERLLIGLHRKLDSKNSFQWVDGAEVVYQNWNSGEPSTITEECAEVWTDSMKWNDIPCDISKGYICSAKKLPPILYEKNNPLGYLQTEKCHQSGDTTGITVLITSICIFAILILGGILVYLFKTRCRKDAHLSPRPNFNLIRF